MEVDAAREISVPGPFVVSDPDIVPIEECPLDAIDYFSEVLEQYPDYLKVGFGLKIDDLPDHYRHKSTVVAWESVCWKQPLATLRRADRHHLCPIPEARELRPAIRTGHPYLARHTTWYLDDSELPEDERHYRVHGDLSVINWGRDDIPGWLARKVKKRKTDSDV